MHLLTDSLVGAAVMPLDEALLNEIAETAFRCDRYSTLPYAHQPSVKKAIESQVAAEVVIQYKRIKLRQHNAIVQQLNALL
ncbi:hypothetical protein [Myxacorys almedinensis]|nr:hypothetical protein [Myxacorys almedinensis]